LQVRAWYRKYGLQSEQLYHEPDDHLGLELSFLAHLAQLGLQALDQQDTAALDQLLREQQAFLGEHPLRWAQAWCDLVNQHARTDFYRGIAWMVNGALEESEEFLRDAISKLNDGEVSH
jgi:TorA maturation chaperone TorD